VDIDAAVAAERRRVADLLESLSPAQLSVPSLCGTLTVREVAGRLVSSSVPTLAALPSAFVALVASGFRPHRAADRLAMRTARRPVADLACELRKLSLPGDLAQLTDLQVHGQDMRRPLGLPHGLDLDRVKVALDHLAPQPRLDGLRLEATDLSWSRGEGPLLAGPAEALMMAAAGRRPALADLDGPGVAQLARRLPIAWRRG
jgi:uncharacterized protein (TIGR03083 family)